MAHPRPPPVNSPQEMSPSLPSWLQGPPPAGSPNSSGNDREPRHLPQDLHRRHFGPPRDYPGGHHCQAATRPAPSKVKSQQGRPMLWSRNQFWVTQDKKTRVGMGEGWGYGGNSPPKRGPKGRGLGACLKPKASPALSPRAWPAKRSCRDCLEFRNPAFTPLPKLRPATAPPSLSSSTAFRSGHSWSNSSCPFSLSTPFPTQPECLAHLPSGHLTSHAVPSLEGQGILRCLAPSLVPRTGPGIHVCAQ